MRRIGGWLSPTNPLSVAPDLGHLFFSVGCSPGGPAQVSACLLQSSPTAISQPWHPSVTVTDWQDTTYDCHVLYSTEPLSSWGCHQGSTSTGTAVCSVRVCVSVSVWSTWVFIMFIVFKYMCRGYTQHECIPPISAGSILHFMCLDSP